MIPIPKPDIIKLNALRVAIDDGIDNGFEYDLKLISIICNRQITNEDMEGIDEDTIDDSLVECVCYGRPDKYEKITKEELNTLFNEIIDNRYTDGQQKWIIEMLEIMYSLPSGFISEKIYYDNMSVDEIWDSIQSYKPICL
jgi:hypothetical protein